MSVPDNGADKNGMKTTGLRFEPERHAKLSLVAKLRDRSLQDEVMTAVDAHIEAAKTDPELLQKIEQAQAEIEREARERQATIVTLFDSAPAPLDQPAPVKPTKVTSSRTSTKPQ